MSTTAESFLVGIRRDFTLTEEGEEIRVRGPRGEYVIREPAGRVRNALLSLARHAASKADVEQRILRDDDFDELTRWYFHLSLLQRANAIVYLVRDGVRDIVEASTMVHGGDFTNRSVDEATADRLSRFAYSHAEDGRTVLATPMSDVRITLLDPRVGALVAALAGEQTPAELAEGAALAPSVTRTCLSLMLSAKLIDAVSGGRLPEDDDVTLRQWEFHDLLFHARTRLGRHDHSIGGTFRFLGQLDPLPAVRPAYASTPIPLSRPATGEAESDDRPFDDVLHARRSIRRHGDVPISADDLGLFLFRAARAQHLLPIDPGAGRHYETSIRPYPSGGATYDLEIYLTVDRCGGLASGVYHYDPQLHGLRLVAAPGPLTDAVLDGARSAAKVDARPQVVITLTSRFQRLSWKYASIAYAATLKNVGVLYEAMYLVATAMRLAPCALGCGDADLFSRIIGSDYYQESSVGEFMLGRA